MGRASQIEGIIAKGNLEELLFVMEDVAASQTDVALAIGAQGVAIGATGVTVKDDDDAASNGTAVNVVPESNGVIAYLESPNAGNADAGFEDADGGVYLVNDNDTPGGVQLYFDEDAAAVDSRFLAVCPGGTDLFVPGSKGEMIRVKHDASAASNGVAVYFDDDGATAAERLLFVSPTDTDGAGATDNELGFAWVSAAKPGLGAIEAFEAPFDFEVVALSAVLSAAATAGTLDVVPTIAGTAKTDPAVQFTTETELYDRAPRGEAIGNAGDAIGVEITTSAGWDAVTADLAVSLMVLFHLEGV
jgi:hypothetical protein